MKIERIKRTLCFAFAWIAAITGFIGIFVPVLPTTPLLLLATYLFANSSPRYHAWIQSTRAYKRYVQPFKESGGISMLRKLSILAISFTVMGISAFLVRNIFVWIVLAAVAIWLLFLMFIRIPTLWRDGSVSTIWQRYKISRVEQSSDT